MRSLYWDVIWIVCGFVVKVGIMVFIILFGMFDVGWLVGLVEVVEWWMKVGFDVVIVFLGVIVVGIELFGLFCCFKDLVIK